MTDLSVYTLAHVQRSVPSLSGDGRWVYLGKDLGAREIVARALGEKRLLSLNDRLHVIADRLRQPFLDFIANLGRIQDDKLGWWSSACSWKDNERSDLFLLVCYGHLVREFVKEARSRNAELLVVIEDIWLFRQLREVYADDPRVGFAGRAAVWPAGLLALVRGVGSRMVWSLRLLWYWTKQRWFWKSDSNGSLASPTVGLYSLPQHRSLRGIDGWSDPYLVDLDTWLEKAGYSILRFSPPESGGFEQVLAQRSRYFAPLILWLTPLSLLRALFTSWCLVQPLCTEVNGFPIRWLLLRDWWLDRWRSSYLLFRVFYDCLTRFLQERRINIIVFPYENQPWERLLALAAQSRQIQTVGYQHGGGLARFTLPYFLGAGEAAWAPLPDLVVASGPYSHDLLAEGGIPLDRLLMGGNLRHQYVRNKCDMELLSAKDGLVRILVALPIDRDLSHHLLDALRRAFPEGGREDGLEFVVKPHPMYPLDKTIVNWPAAILDGTFEGALQGCAAVIYSGSGTGMEALVLGKTVLRYRSELLINADRGEFLKGESVIDCGDYDLKEKLLSAVRANPLSYACQEAVDNLLNWVFPPPDSEVWLQAIKRLCADKVAGDPVNCVYPTPKPLASGR